MSAKLFTRCSAFLFPFMSLLYAEDFPVLIVNAPDNSAGFAVFERAGLLPVPEGAQPARHIFSAERSSRMHSISYSGGQSYAGWFWEEDGEIKLLRGNRMWDGPVRASSGMRMRSSPAEDAVTVMSADLMRDLRRQFDQWNRNREQGRTLRIGPRELGNYMIMAVRLHQVGHPDIANQLAAFLFETAGRRETLVAGLSALHDLNYHDRFQDYLLDGELEALAEALDAMLTQHRATWLSAAIADEVLETWRTALGDPAPELPAAFSDAQRELYELFVSDRDPAFYSMLSGEENWLLRPKRLMIREARDHGFLNDETRAFFETLWDLGADAIPVFIALVEDVRVLPLSAQEVSGNRHNPFSGGREDWELRELRRSFPRPVQLSELAEQWLRAVHPDELDTLSGGELTAAAEEVHAAFRGKTRLEIAKFLYERGESFDELGPDVVFTLLASGDSEIIGEIREKVSARVQTAHLYELGDVASWTPLFEGEEGAAFRREVADIISERFGEKLEEEDSWEKEMIEQLLASLQPPEAAEAADGEDAVPAGLTLDGLADLVLKGESPRPNDFLQLRALTRDTEAVQRVLLARLDAAEESGQKVQLIQLTLGLLQMSGMDESDFGMHSDSSDMLLYYLDPEGDGPDVADTEEPDVVGTEGAEGGETEIHLIPELWLPLLEGDDPAILSAAAFGILMLQLDDMDKLVGIHQAMASAGPGDGAGVAELLLPAARTVLEGGEVDWSAVLPDSGNVSEERAEEMSAVLRGSDVEALLNLLNSADMNEALWILEQLDRPSIQNNKDLWSAMTGPRRKVIHLADDLPEWLEDLPAVGGALTKDHLLALLQQVQDAARQGESGMMYIRETGIKPGVSILFSTDRMMRGQTTDGVHVMLHGPNFYGMRSFGLEDEVRLTKLSEDEMTEEMMMMGMYGGEDFHKTVDAWLTPADIPYGAQTIFMIQFKGPEPEETPEP
ncbi:MAG: hypothetical protein JJU05_00670 [Verrucomicrobia bacterium]|nr:hypothetical protein [Verrucomicrobiota bacterium]MCH8526340.1 hypothetical protein [Kiritimatiellia bacterium]